MCLNCAVTAPVISLKYTRISCVCLHKSYGIVLSYTYIGRLFNPNFEAWQRYDIKSSLERHSAIFFHHRCRANTFISRTNWLHFFTRHHSQPFFLFRQLFFFFFHLLLSRLSLFPLHVYSYSTLIAHNKRAWAICMWGLWIKSSSMMLFSLPLLSLHHLHFILPVSPSTYDIHAYIYTYIYGRRVGSACSPPLRVPCPAYDKPPSVIFPIVAIYTCLCVHTTQIGSNVDDESFREGENVRPT